MDTNIFLDYAIQYVFDWANAHIDKTDKIQITKNDIYIVWYCKTLQNNKALLSTNLPDGMYYEVTYNGDKCEVYIDAYKKFDHICVLPTLESC